MKYPQPTEEVLLQRGWGLIVFYFTAYFLVVGEQPIA